MACLFGYLVGTFPTRELAARIAAGRSDATVSDVDHHAPGTQVAGVVAVVAKSALAAVGGASLARLPGTIAATAGSLAGDRFPVWRYLKRNRKAAPPA